MPDFCADETVASIADDKSMRSCFDLQTIDDQRNKFHDLLSYDVVFGFNSQSDLTIKLYILTKIFGGKTTE
jgi:hypothetical protein